MASTHDGGEWLYHLPAFLDRVRKQGAQRVVENLDMEIGGVLYHHRGARVPGHNATFVWGEETETFEIEIDAIGSRSAWAVFDAERNWDFYLFHASGDTPCLAWMSGAEFDAEEADTFDRKEQAIGMGRFSFGLYLQPPSAWDDLEARARESDAACFVHRPSGRTVVPEDDLGAYESVMPPELLPNGDDPPEYLGLVEAHVSSE